MLCKLNRDGEYLICECCGFKIKSNKDKIKVTCKGGENCQVQEHPSIYEIIKNASISTVEYISDGMTNVDEIEQNRRLEICRGCEHYDKEGNRCFKCGCFLNFKTAMRSGKCPIDKW